MCRGAVVFRSLWCKSQVPSGKLTRVAQQRVNNRILLIPDCNKEDETSLKEFLWKLPVAGIQVCLGRSSETHLDCQPETLAQDEWQQLSKNLSNKTHWPLRAM